MKNILITTISALFIISLIFNGVVLFSKKSYSKDKKEKKSSTTMRSSDSKRVSVIDTLISNSTWNIIQSEQINNLQTAVISEAWNGLFDGEYQNTITLYNNLDSVEIKLSSIGPSGVGIASCFTEDLQTSQNAYVSDSFVALFNTEAQKNTQDLENISPRMTIVPKNNFSFSGDDDFETLSKNFNEAQSTNDTFAYCEKNVLNYINSNTLKNAKSGESISKLYIPEILSFSPTSRAEFILNELEKLSNIRSEEI